MELDTSINRCILAFSLGSGERTMVTGVSARLFLAFGYEVYRLFGPSGAMRARYSF